MRPFHLVVAFVALLAAPAVAQQSPPDSAPAYGPPPEMQQRMEAAHAAAHSAAMATLSSDHQRAVGALVDQLNSGQITDIHDAAQKIDAVLTKKEAEAVLAARDKMMTDLRGSMAGPPGDGPRGEGPPGDGPPGGGQSGNGPPGGGGGRGFGEHRGGLGGGGRMRNDAGLALLMLSLDRDHLRSLFMRPPGDR